LWASCLAVAVLLLWVAGRVAGPPSPRDIAFRGALGALVLTAMSLEVPIGPVEYHVSLLGPLGVLLGGASAYLVLFVVSTMLAAIGHGGVTVVGVNALVLGTGALLARPVFTIAARRMAPGPAMAWAAGVSQAVAGAVWVVVVRYALDATHAAHGAPAAAAGHAAPGLPIAAGLVAALWCVGVAVESTVAYGLGRFLARVKPELLPLPGGAEGRIREAAA